MKLIFMLSVFTLCESRPAFPDLTNKTFLIECRVAHNNYRAKHKTTPALKMNNTIVAYAKTRCNTISKYEKLNHGHKGLVGYGENLYWGASASSVSKGSDAIKLWYDEISKYNYSNPGFSSATGHFTQVVWKSSVNVGCARCGGKGSEWYETYVVCNYSPPGNRLNKFKQNVLPLK